MTKQRRLTLRELTLAVLAIPACVLVAVSCQYTDLPTSPSGTRTGSPGSPAVPLGPGAISGVISANHGHTAVLSPEQMQRRAAVRLDIQGSADHSHTLDLDTEDVAVINSGGGVTKRSSQDAGHDHVVTFPGAWDY